LKDKRIEITQLLHREFKDLTDIEILDNLKENRCIIQLPE